MRVCLTESSLKLFLFLVLSNSASSPEAVSFACRGCLFRSSVSRPPGSDHLQRPGAHQSEGQGARSDRFRAQCWTGSLRRSSHGWLVLFRRLGEPTKRRENHHCWGFSRSPKTTWCMPFEVPETQVLFARRNRFVQEKPIEIFQPVKKEFSNNIGLNRRGTRP